MTSANEPQTSRFGPDTSAKMEAHITQHNAGLHAGSYRPAGCPGCLLSGALDGRRGR